MVIIQFETLENRDEWCNDNQQSVKIVYNRNPWVLAEISNEQAEQLKQVPNIKVYLDAQMGSLPSRKEDGLELLRSELPWGDQIKERLREYCRARTFAASSNSSATF